MGQAASLRGGCLPPPAGETRVRPIHNRPQLNKLPHRGRSDKMNISDTVLGAPLVKGCSQLPWIHLAYIGPGAGFAFLGSFLTLLAGFLMSVVSFLLWPFRTSWRVIRRRRGFQRARVKKIIFLGLDGLDPQLTEQFMAEGKLPNLARLASEGSYHRLRTTFPALSPVAWSTFATGVSPAKHNIFDFLDRSLKTYLPQLSSARVGRPRRVLHLGRLRIPLSQPMLELRRKSQPFWKILGGHGIGCTILRVPITFPPEKFDGKLLSAMCTPDLKGTQGSFSQFTTRIEKATYENGSRYPLRRVADGFEGEVEGPADTFLENETPLRIPFRVVSKNGAFELRWQQRSCRLTPGEYTPWQRLAFRTAIGSKANGMARFLVTETGPEFSMYVSPINIDPERPALPISHPSYYAVYLANLLGPYSTLGMAEDTWALNEGVIDEDAFLSQAYDIFEERKAMYMEALESTRRGVVACVFDTSDRIQHMFFRHLATSDRHQGTIAEMYQQMDDLVGKTLPFVQPDTALFVLSDHGFCAFRRGVNINSWLRDNGYLYLKNGKQESGPFFEGVDWNAHARVRVGAGRLLLEPQESRGVRHRRARPGGRAVETGNYRETLHVARRERRCADPRRLRHSSLYRGPYLDAAPDFVVGYNTGYRCSWDGAVGKVATLTLEDNQKAWSGDHCVDPAFVPGVLFSNRKVGGHESRH